MIQGKHPTGPIPAGARTHCLAAPCPTELCLTSHLIHALAWFGSTISRAPFHAGGRTVERSTDRPDIKIRISSRFTARSLCRNRGPCWSARPPSLRCALRFGLLFSRFSVPPSLRGLSPHHPISCRRVLPAPKGLRLPCSYLLGLPPSGSSFQRASAAPLAFPVRCEATIPTGKK